MSVRKPEIAQGRPSFASRTAFELLAPPSDEDSEAEDDQEQLKEEAKLREESHVTEACVCVVYHHLLTSEIPQN